MNYQQLGNDIIQNIGGIDNIKQLTHCATRLRFEFYDMNKVNTKKVESLNGVISVVEKGGQYQVVIGNEVQSVFRAIQSQMKDVPSTSHEKSDEEKGSIVNRIISVISTTFTPVIPALIGGGMIKAVLSILVLFNLVNEASSTYEIINFISDAPFYFMPVLLAYGASQKFKTSPIMAMTMACALLHPTWSGLVAAGSPLIFFGAPVVLVDYASSVIPIILSVWIMSYVEKFAEKYSPSIIKFFLKPLLVMFISVPIALIIVGPLGNLLNDLVQSGANYLNAHVSWLIPMLMGAFQPFLTLTGTAWAMTPIATSQISTLGYEIVNGPGMLASNIAQGGATLAVALKAKDENLKSLASSSGFTAVMGITEPCLYGVLLKLKRPFVASMIGGAAGGIYAGITGLVRYAFVSPGLTAIPAFIGKNPMNVVHAIVTIIISFVVGFVASWILGFKEDSPQEEVVDTVSKDEIVAPCDGTVKPLSEVNDDVFSQEIMGKGIAIEPSAGNLYAPCDGTITVCFPTGHAIGLKSKNGTEILMHVGIDTVNLQGKYFSPQIQVNEEVKKGQLLLTFDLDKIKEEGYDTTTPIIITNSKNFSSIQIEKQSTTQHGNKLISLD